MNTEKSRQFYYDTTVNNSIPAPPPPPLESLLTHRKRSHIALRIVLPALSILLLSGLVMGVFLLYVRTASTVLRLSPGATSTIPQVSPAYAAGLDSLDYATFVHALREALLARDANRIEPHVDVAGFKVVCYPNVITRGACLYAWKDIKQQIASGELRLTIPLDAVTNPPDFTTGPPDPCANYYGGTTVVYGFAENSSSTFGVASFTTATFQFTTEAPWAWQGLYFCPAS